MHFDAIIVGAGPGGLACAAKLAAGGIKVLVLERKTTVGPKSCAGGITWSGLIQRVPEELIEKAFPSQHIFTRLQKIRVTEDDPIIATVNRTNLGSYMADEARWAGAEILTSTAVQSIKKKKIVAIDVITREEMEYGYDYLIGADGSTSFVRKHLGIPCEKTGLGINFQVDLPHDQMEWHLLPKYFQNGYGWIFPHKRTTSIGAYVPHNGLPGSILKKRLQDWAQDRGFNLFNLQCTAGYINYDYRGYHFGNIFLVGDAAGFASALTGEGIYPAIISGEAVAEKIIDSKAELPQMERLIKQQKRFSKITKSTSKSKFLAALLAELGPLALRTGLLNFKMLEMSK